MAVSPLSVASLGLFLYFSEAFSLLLPHAFALGFAN